MGIPFVCTVLPTERIVGPEYGTPLLLKEGVPSGVEEFVSAVRPYVMRLGWREGNREYQRAVSAGGETPGFDMSLFGSGQGVWKLLLPGNFDDDLLIADASLGAVPLDLSRSYRRVIVCPWHERSADIIRKRAGEEGASNIHVCEGLDAGELRRLGCRVGTSVAVITCGMLDSWGERDVAARISSLLGAVSGFGEPGWTHVFLFPKKYRIALSAKITGMFRQAGMSRHTLMKAGAPHGLVSGRTYHLRHTPERIVEIHAGSLNARIGGEKGCTVRQGAGKTPAMRRIVQAVKSAPLSHPAQVLALSRGKSPSTWLEGFLAHLEDRGVAGGGLSVRSYIAGRPNMILLALESRSGSSSICRLPLGRGPVSAGRAENNYAALQRLQLCGGLSGLSPRPLGRGTYRGQEYYVEACLAGDKLRLTPGNQSQVYEMIRPVLLSFYREAGRDAVIEEPVFWGLAGESLAALKRSAWRREDAARLADLERALRRTLLGARVRLPIVHGDFKIENMLFGTGRLSGVFDWDLSMFPGPPYLDLLYLYGYSFHHRPLEGGNGIMGFIGRRLLSGDPGPVLESWCKDYSSSLSIPSEWREVSGALFWLHYVTRTIGMAMSVYDGPAYERNIRVPLEIISEKVGRW